MHGRNDDESSDKDVQSTMIRAEWTQLMSETCLPKGKHVLGCIRKVSDLATEAVWIVNDRQAYVVQEPESSALRSYKTEFDIKQAFWYTFPASTATGDDHLECLCLVGEQSIDFYSTVDDHYYTCSVPFKIIGVYQTSHALILERALLDRRLFSPPPSYFMPRIFSLAHPYDEALPVLCNQKGQYRLVYCWEGDSNVEVIGSSHDLVLAYDAVTSQHRLYALRSNDPNALNTTKEGNDLLPRLATPRINPDQAHTPTNEVAMGSARAGGGGTVRTTLRGRVAMSAAARVAKSHHHLAPLANASPITPTLGGGGGAGGGGHVPFNSRFTPNRSQHSIRSMGDSSPFVRLARLPATSTPRVAFAPGTAAPSTAVGGLALTPVLQQSAAMKRLSSPYATATQQNEADAEEEMLISSMWLELLWTEKETSERATKMFVSFDLNHVSYINWLTSAGLATMKIALPSTNRAQTLICLPGAAPVLAPAFNAEYIESSRLTATVSPDQSTVVMYSGSTKIAVLVIRMPLASPARFRLLCTCQRTLALETLNGVVLHVRLPSLFRSQFAARIWDTLWETLTTSGDKMAKLLAAWITMNKEKEMDAPDEVAALTRLIMEHAGMTVEELPPETVRAEATTVPTKSTVSDATVSLPSTVAASAADDEVDDDTMVARVLVDMTNGEKATVTMGKVQGILEKVKRKRSVSSSVTDENVAAVAGGAAGKMMTSSSVQDTNGAKHSRSDEGECMSDDEKWRLICDVLQATNGAFPHPHITKAPLRSVGPRLNADHDCADGTDTDGKASSIRCELTARTPSPVEEAGSSKKEHDLNDQFWSEMSPRLQQAYKMCYRVRQAAKDAETPRPLVMKRRRRLVVTVSKEADAPLSSLVPLVFQTLHLSYEDAKMHVADYPLLRVLGLHLFVFARWQALVAYANYYARDYPFLREIQVLVRGSPSSEDMTPLSPLRDSAVDDDAEGGGGRAAEGQQVRSWERAKRTPGVQRTGGSYGGLLQLRRTQATAAAMTPTTSNMFTPPTGTGRGQVLQPPAAAALSSFSPTNVPSVSEYICSLLHLSGHASAIAAYETLMPKRSAPCCRMGVSAHNARHRHPSPHNSSASSMMCSPLPPEVSSGTFSSAPPATPQASGLFLAVGVGLGLVRTSGDITRMLGVNWPRRLRLATTEAQNRLLEVVNDLREEMTTRCDRVFLTLGWTAEAVNNLNPSLMLLIALITSRPKPMRPSPFFGKIEQLEKLSEFPSKSDTQQLIRRRWPKDLRVDNVVTMMDSSRPIFVPTRKSNMNLPSDSEIKEIQDTFLTAVNHRTLAQAFGRGLLYFRTQLPNPKEPIPVKELSLSAKMHPSNLPIDVIPTETTKLLREWGEFYNAVAAGLEVVSAETAQGDSEWLTMCQIQDKNTVSAGLLYSFGLSGHIAAMNMFNVHELLTFQDKMTSIGLLLGYSCAFIGSGDVQVHKMLVTHLPFLMGPTVLDIKVDSLLQTTSVCGLGLLFAKTSRTSLIHHLINEMGREPDVESEPANDRYSYGLSCGFSIGLIGLGDGNNIAVRNVPFKQPLSSIAERLITLMNGGCRADCVYMSSQSDIALASGMVNGEAMGGHMGGCPTPGGPNHHGASGGHGAPPPSSHVKEDPDQVNVHVTGHGATIALGLLFFKSNNRHIIQSLALPNTIYDLESIRPDLISVRVLCKALVEWDSIRCDMNWVRNQVPEIIRTYESRIIRMDDEDFSPSRESKRYYEKIVDRETVAQTYLYAISGALFALSLKFPSTGRADIAALLYYYIKVLMPSRENSHPDLSSQLSHGKPEGYARMCRLAGQSCVSDCLHTIVLALAVLFAGTGDLDALRVCRALRMGGGGDPMKWAKETISMHAQQSSAHMAMGMILAGSGRYGLKSDDLSVALLVIALYPISCAHVADNKMYLQPLRFLWSLCLEPRLLYTVSALSAEPTAESIRYEWADDVMIGPIERRSNDFTVPVVIPPLSMLSSVTIGGDAVDSITFNLRCDHDRQELEKIMRVQFGRIAHRAGEGQDSLFEKSLIECQASDEHDMKKWDSDQMANLEVDMKKLSSIMASLQPPTNDPLYQLGEGAASIAKDTTVTDFRRTAHRWCVERGTMDVEMMVMSLFKRLMCEDLAECAIAYNEASMLCRVLEGRTESKLIDQRLVTLIDEFMTRKVSESRPQQLAPRNYRLRCKDVIDPAIFSIL